ncbi:hypothetical protein J2X14_000651 [Pantoea alhagi]|nr:hypothetical protein [Pantoea alhagi]
MRQHLYCQFNLTTSTYKRTGFAGRNGKAGALYNVTLMLGKG